VQADLVQKCAVAVEVFQAIQVHIPKKQSLWWKAVLCVLLWANLVATQTTYVTEADQHPLKCVGLAMKVWMVACVLKAVLVVDHSVLQGLHCTAVL
jgi:hypothetical protein